MDVQLLEERLGYTFSNKIYIENALTHPSTRTNNEFQRLEFLGDAVLEFCISIYLYVNFPDVNEGELTLYRSLIVKKSSLLKIANNLQLEQFIKFNVTDNFVIPKSVLSDAVESLIGGIYLDTGNDMTKTYEIIIKLFHPLLEELFGITQKYDYKSLLQQNCHKKGLPDPIYNLVKTSVLKNKSIFEVAVEIDSKIVGYGVGRTIKEAQQNAAKVALENNQ